MRPIRARIFGDDIGKMIIKVKIDDSPVKELFARLSARVQDMTPAMRNIGEIIRASIDRNFASEGRPEKWQKSKRAEHEGGLTLTDTGILRRSFTVSAYPDRAEVGTNVKYAAIHQFGGDIQHPARERTIFMRQYKKGKYGGKTLFAKQSKASFGMKVMGGAYTIHMPARPFLMIQDEDWEKMERMLENYITEGNV